MNTGFHAQVASLFHCTKSNPSLECATTAHDALVALLGACHPVRDLSDLAGPVWTQGECWSVIMTVPWPFLVTLSSLTSMRASASTHVRLSRSGMPGLFVK